MTIQNQSPEPTQFLRQIESFREPTGYMREKLVTVRHDFEIWFSPRRWQRWGKSGSEFQGLLYASVGKLKGAVDSRLARIGERQEPS